MNTILYAACSAAATLLLSLDAVAQSASPPAAPVVTMGAQLKYLRFDWEPVAGASYYQLFERLGNSAYTPISGQLPASITEARKYMAVHRENWANTRYQVQACNAAGCTGSAPLDPQPLMLDIIGYFKASNSEAGDQFGREAVISDDGLTLAVTAQNESSSASGVNGDQEDNSSGQSGAVYIFKGNGSVWRQEAYLKMPSNRDGAFFGTGIPFLHQRAVALSRNGSVAAIGAPAVDSGEFGRQGLVYVYERATTGWRHTATITPPEPQTAGYFGYSVELSLDGRTLKVNSLPPRVDDEYEARTHIFQRVGSTWQLETTLAPYHAGDYCAVVRMSGDGLTLVANCFSLSQIYRAVTYKRIGGTWVYAGDLYLSRYNSLRQVALNNDGTALALQLNQGSTSGVGLYGWNGTAWVSEQFITRAVPGTTGGFGLTLAFDRPGNQLAIGDPYSLADGAGVSNTPTPGNAQHGAVYMYRRSSAATSPWRLRTVVKAPNPGEDLFGSSISLSGSGSTLAVGADLEDSNARGVDGDRLDESTPDAGAAYLY